MEVPGVQFVAYARADIGKRRFEFLHRIGNRRLHGRRGLRVPRGKGHVSGWGVPAHNFQGLHDAPEGNLCRRTDGNGRLGRQRAQLADQPVPGHFPSAHMKRILVHVNGIRVRVFKLPEPLPEVFPSRLPRDLALEDSDPFLTGLRLNGRRAEDGGRDTDDYLLHREPFPKRAPLSTLASDVIRASLTAPEPGRSRAPSRRTPGTIGTLRPDTIFMKKRREEVTAFRRREPAIRTVPMEPFPAEDSRTSGRRGRAGGQPACVAVRGRLG